MVSLSTLPNALLISNSQNPPILFANPSSPFQIRPILKSHRANFPALAAAGRPPALQAVATPNAAILQDRDGLASRWQEIMGSNNWKGLLKPMDPLLRLELLKYGDLAACTYDGFISDIYALDYGVCNYELDDFFDRPVMPKHGYNVSKYIYCTSNKYFWPPFIPKPINPRTWKQNNVWIGFIAVSDDKTTKILGRRDICVVWRGTITSIEWQNDFLANMVSLPADMPSPNSDIRVANGFLTLYTQKDNEDFSARGLVLSEVRRLVNKVYPGEKLSITVTGHSLGGALAALSAYDIMESGANGKVPVTAITYAGAKVGNGDFVKRVEQLGLKALRIVNYHDWVPSVPPFASNIGVKLELDNDDSPYVKPLPSYITDAKLRLSKAHDLELYLHLIDGYPGKGKNFKLATGRHLALLNKYNDALKDNYFLKPAWRVEQDNNMVLHNGYWVHDSTVNYLSQNLLKNIV